MLIILRGLFARQRRPRCHRLRSFAHTHSACRHGRLAAALACAVPRMARTSSIFLLSLCLACTADFSQALGQCRSPLARIPYRPPRHGPVRTMLIRWAVPSAIRSGRPSSGTFKAASSLAFCLSFSASRFRLPSACRTLGSSFTPPRLARRPVPSRWKGVRLQPSRGSMIHKGP